MLKLGKTAGLHEVMVTASSADCLVSEALADIRRQLPDPFDRILQMSERYGSVVFLALINRGGTERLIETKRLSDYQLSDGCTLWLMCAHVTS